MTDTILSPEVMASLVKRSGDTFDFRFGCSNGCGGRSTHEGELCPYCGVGKFTEVL